jgi:3-oxoacyl-[acyl-carrier-protein] synthase II
MRLEPHNRRVVITGFGMVTPLGKDSEETFARARRGTSGIRTLTNFDSRGLPCRIGGEVDDRWLDSPELREWHGLHAYASRGLLFMRRALQEAAAQAGLEDIADRHRIGVALGYHGENPSVPDMLQLHRFRDAEGHWDMRGLLASEGYGPCNFFRRRPDVATAVLGELFHCRGPGLTVTSACAAGAQAIGEAFRVVRMGGADAMVAGGCESLLNFSGFLGFVLIKALVEKYSSPETASRPFDRRRNGFVMSEGAGVVVLEELEHAAARGAVVCGEVLGYGSSADAYRITDPHPEAAGAVLAMQGALADAGLSPADIDYINAHGTSTVLNDITETAAIQAVFGEGSSRIPVSSNKSMLGHPIAAAGAIECILTVMGMAQGVILPTINYQFVDPRCRLDYVPNEARLQPHSKALCNSFGFGGQNACLCLGRSAE